MGYIIPILFAATLLADAVVWQFVVSRCRSRILQQSYLVAVAATDLPMAFVFLLGWLLPDNPLWVVRSTMWVMTIYIISVFPRGVFWLSLPFARRYCKITAVAAVAAIAVVAIPVDGVLRGRKALTIRETNVVSSRLPKEFDGLRIVQFSDLHVGTLLHPRSETRAVVDAINALHPDIVIFSGDLMTVRYDEIDEAIVEILAGIDAPLGVWSSVGNHDAGLYVKDTVQLPKAENRARLLTLERRAGWRILDNETVWIRRGDDSLSLSGVSFPEDMEDDKHSSKVPETDISSVYAGVASEKYNITISHMPQFWDKIIESGFGDLTLAGHYHAMQFGVEAGPVRWSPARLFHREWSGRYDRCGHTLYINDGTGYAGLFMRIGMLPEITLLTLSKAVSE